MDMSHIRILKTISVLYFTQRLTTIPLKGHNKLFGSNFNNLNKSKCLLSFGTEIFVSSFLFENTGCST